MAVQDGVIQQINRIKTNVNNAYLIVQAKGGTVPETKNSANLAGAVATIPVSSGGQGSTEYDLIIAGTYGDLTEANCEIIKTGKYKYFREN